MQPDRSRVSPLLPPQLMCQAHSSQGRRAQVWVPAGCRASPPGSGCCRPLLPQTFGQRLYQQYTCYTVFFISIEMCQIADVLIRKTRRLSAFQQGFFRCPCWPARPPCSGLDSH